MVNIAFTGGGTGGHIYPGLAVALELKKQTAGGECRIFWIGSSAGMDRSIVEETGIEFFGVPSGKLRRYFSLRNVTDFFLIAAGFFASRKILKKKKTGLLFSKGGFVSVPPCAAAATLNIPVFTHESDFSPGLATKLNTRFVSRTGGRIFTAYSDTVRFFPEKLAGRITVSGNPVRSAFRSADAARGRSFLNVDEGMRILLVLGGSQGAREINELVRAALAGLTEVYTVVHQSGPNQQWDLPASRKYKPFPFIGEEMPDVMAAAELVMGRSGAGIWEWAVCGKPMLLIPLTGSGTRGDQVENARYFEKAGAAQVLIGDVTAQTLTSAVTALARDSDKREAMAKASSRIGEIDGTQIIAHALAGEIALKLNGR
ncbi:MAG: undecaprenyldiphospho-muramoylpentapeptide beta-N-acetylglucosaminyltransferase [Treponema sp.]|jgi:UDP-N-acetylglucosamine--N-acetylmuramyl-(pentapeptide) pyrophosphoryl-undecaprenol N-acetylglucosamine transferase|nr:undecaprenyldiphospho-muramoylpentapeptide beta-N-acetylglucosaminyltransferase [Treponema sp.]